MSDGHATPDHAAERSSRMLSHKYRCRVCGARLVPVWQGDGWAHRPKRGELTCDNPYPMTEEQWKATRQ